MDMRIPVWKWMVLGILGVVFVGLIVYYLTIGRVTSDEANQESRDSRIPEEIVPETTPVFEGT